MKKLNIMRAIPFLLAIIMSGAVAYAASPAALNMGTTDGFAVLAGSTITNTGSSVVTGDIGLYPGSAVTGFPPGVFVGTQHIGDAAAISAQTSLGNAYTDAMSRSASIIGTELGGTVLVPGAYTSNSGTFGLTGTVTLDAGGDANAIFILKSASTFITAGGSNVVLAGGTQACNVFWVVGSSATLGANSSFKGNILANNSITLTTGANVSGSVFARSGAVTLDGNVVARSACAAPVVSVTATTTVAVNTATSTLTVIKSVINDNGGTKLVSDFVLRVDSTIVTSGVANNFTPGIKSVSETTLPGYTAGSWGGDCNSSGTVTLNAGDVKTCTITNNDIATSTPVVIQPVVTYPALFCTQIIPQGKVGESVGWIATGGNGVYVWTPTDGSPVEGSSVYIHTYNTAGLKTVNLSSAGYTAICSVNVFGTVPTFPNTGFGPKEDASKPVTIVLGMLIFAFAAYLARKKQTI